MIMNKKSQPSIAFVLVAGGVGARMQSDVPKQFLPLGNYPIFIHAIKKFHTTFPQGQIIVVCNAAYIEETQKLATLYIPTIKIEYIAGGTTRFHSVQNGLAKVLTEIVMIHDAVRPFITTDFLLELVESCTQKGNAIPSIMINESVRIIEGNENTLIDRSNLRLIQTPQTFKTNLIQKAFEQDYQEKFTDDASVLENIGEKINLVNGLKWNFKITQPEDYSLAQLLINKLD